MFHNIYYSDKTGVPYIVFNNIDFIFKKMVTIKIFCDNKKNKSMRNIYLKIVKQLKDEIFL